MNVVIQRAVQSPRMPVLPGMQIALDHTTDSGAISSRTVDAGKLSVEIDVVCLMEHCCTTTPVADPKPSRDDIEMTRAIKTAAEALGTRFTAKRGARP